MASEGYVDLLVILRPNEGRTEELNKVLEELREASLAEPGCVHYRIAQSSSESPTVFLQERWVDSDALRHHETTPHFVSGVEKIQPLCAAVEIHPVAWGDSL